MSGPLVGRGDVREVASMRAYVRASASLSVEDFRQPGFAAIAVAAALSALAIFPAFAILAALAIASVAGMLLWVWLRMGLGLRLRRSGMLLLLSLLGGAFLDDLVELAAVEPAAAAFRAIVDLDILALGHYQVDFAGGAQESGGGGLGHLILPMMQRSTGLTVAARFGVGGVMVIL